MGLRGSCAEEGWITSRRRPTADYARPANRASMAPDFASPDSGIGFRVVQAAAPESEPLKYEAPEQAHPWAHAAEARAQCAHAIESWLTLTNSFYFAAGDSSGKLLTWCLPAAN